MKINKAKLTEAVRSVASEFRPLREVKKWSVPMAEDNGVSNLQSPEYLGMPLAERVMKHLRRTMPLEGIFYDVMPTEFGGPDTLLADYSDFGAPIYMLVRCENEDSFDYQVLGNEGEVLMSANGIPLEQLVSTIREMHEAAVQCSQKARMDEGKFFKAKYEALKRVYNDETKPFK